MVGLRPYSPFLVFPLKGTGKTRAEECCVQKMNLRRMQTARVVLMLCLLGKQLAIFDSEVVITYLVPIPLQVGEEV